MSANPSMRPTGKRGCAGHTRSGKLCNQPAVDGTDLCRIHPGRPLAEHKAKGRLVLTAREYGFNDQVAEQVDTAGYMLRLTAGAFAQAKMYERLLAEAYDAAERLRDSYGAGVHLDGDEDLPRHEDNPTDRERALYDLQRVFRDGGVSVLIGAKYAAAGKDGDLYQAEEGIRSLVDLWNAERDRAFRFAKDCRAAKVDERLVELAEGHARQVADLLAATLSALDGLLQAGELTSVAPSNPVVLRVLAEQLPALPGAAA